MSDNDPNKKLNNKRLSVELSTMKLNLERFDLRLMELDEEKVKINENIDATNKRIKEIDKILTEG